MKVTMDLNDDVIFMFSSVHNWMDTRILNKEALSLAEYGKIVEFYAVGSFKGELNYDPVDIHFLDEGSKFSRPKRWIYLLKEALLSEAKFYHFHDPELLWVAQQLKKKKPKAIIIYDMHEYFYGQLCTKEWIPSLVRKPLAVTVRYLEQKWMESCDGVIYAEESYEQHFKNYKGKTVEVLNYPLWVEREEGVNEPGYTLLYVGDITEDRNVFGMIEIVYYLSKQTSHPFRLKLIGSINPELKNRVMEKIREYQIEKYVIWYGRLPYVDIWAHCFSADVGLCLLKPIPNYINSMATKLYEYMAAELPIVASNFPDWATLIEENKCGFTVNPLDNEAAAIKIEELWLNNKVAQNFGENGRVAFETKYSWESEKKKLISFYDAFLP